MVSFAKALRYPMQCECNLIHNIQSTEKLSTSHKLLSTKHMVHSDSVFMSSVMGAGAEMLPMFYILSELPL